MSGSLAILGLLGALSVGLSAQPPPIKALLGLLAAGYGFWLSMHELRKPVFKAVLAAPEGRITLLFARDSVVLAKPSILVRGPLVVLRGTGADGRVLRAIWWPDTLSVQSRRALRLASGDWTANSAPAFATMQG